MRYYFKTHGYKLKTILEDNQWVTYKYPYDVFVGIVSPHTKHYFIKKAVKKGESIWHTDDDVHMVRALLRRNNMKYKLYNLDTEELIESTFPQYLTQITNEKD